MEIPTLERKNLVQVKNTPKAIDLWKAVNVLCLPVYERYKRVRKEAISELRLEINDDGLFLVLGCSNMTECIPVLFLTRNSRCNARKGHVAHE